jgi:hypothetical protein
MSPFQGCQGLLAVECPRLRQGVGTLLDQVHRGGVGQKIGQLAGQFHPAWASPDYGNALLDAASLPQSFDQLMEALHIRQSAEK